ncbi:MAG: hypothetical protein UU15_C0030G0007, partial [Candidatus Levybacteria bacterium GW2011_GWC2_40_7]
LIKTVNHSSTARVQRRLSQAFVKTAITGCMTLADGA